MYRVFAVFFSDGTPAIAGTGACRGGEMRGERVNERREDALYEGGGKGRHMRKGGGG